MKWVFYILMLNMCMLLHAKEWKSLKVYQKTTHLQNLSASDWLKSDRIHNSVVWTSANSFNLDYNLPEEYNNIEQRRDFYKWADSEVEKQGQQVVWFKMVHFISGKLHVIETFPSSIFANKKIMNYANDCSESIFNNSFVEINNFFKLKVILNEEDALKWDEAMIYKEQYLWVDTIINTIDLKSLEKIQNILKGRFLYSLLVPKAIRFNGDLSNKETRYEYAIKNLRVYCKTL